MLADPTITESEETDIEPNAKCKAKLARHRLKLQAEVKRTGKLLKKLPWLDAEGKPEVWKTDNDRDGMDFEKLVWAMLKCGSRSIPFPAFRISTYRYTHDFRSPSKAPEQDECAVVMISAPCKFTPSTNSFLVSKKSIIPYFGKGDEAEMWCPKMMCYLKLVSNCCITFFARYVNLNFTYLIFRFVTADVEQSIRVRR